MCPYQAKFTIFQVLTLLLLLGGAVCVVCNVSVWWCVVWVCAVCVVCFGVLLVFCWCVWLYVLVCVVVCVVMVCRTRYQDHGIHFHIDVHVGVNSFCSFSHKKRSPKTPSVHAYHLEVNPCRRPKPRRFTCCAVLTSVWHCPLPSLQFIFLFVSWIMCPSFRFFSVNV